MSAPRAALLGLVAAVLLHGHARPQGLEDASLTARALAVHAWDDCHARGIAGIERSDACLSRAMASAKHIGLAVQANRTAQTRFFACLTRLEAGTLPGPRTASHLDKVDACVSASARVR